MNLDLRDILYLVVCLHVAERHFKADAETPDLTEENRQAALYFAKEADRLARAFEYQLDNKGDSPYA
jgi:hypothetical protein